MLYYIRDLLYSGDPVIRTWFLIGNDYLPAILCGSYVLFVTIIGPSIMKNREPYDLKIPMIVYSFSLVVIYTVNVSTILWYWPTIPIQDMCKGLDWKENTEIKYKMVSAAWVCYILKYIEFTDTVFFTLRKKRKQITYLHVIHHTTIPLFSWFIARTETGAMSLVPGILNLVVHIIMYTYYGLAAMGLKKYLWWKKYLTQLQLMQFVLMIFIVTLVNPLAGCKMLPSTFVLNFVIGVAFFCLFYNFYRKNFVDASIYSITNKEAEEVFVENELQKKTS